MLFFFIRFVIRHIFHVTFHDKLELQWRKKWKLQKWRNQTWT